jgi:hypothetical protein
LAKVLAKIKTAIPIIEYLTFLLGYIPHIKSIMDMAIGATIYMLMYVRVVLSMTWLKTSTFRNMIAYMLIKDIISMNANF